MLLSDLEGLGHILVFCMAPDSGLQTPEAHAGMEGFTWTLLQHCNLIHDGCLHIAADHSIMSIPNLDFPTKSKHLKTQPLWPSLIAAKFKPIYLITQQRKMTQNHQKSHLSNADGQQNQGELVNHRPRLSFPAVILSVLPGIPHIPSTT